jgi:predicted CoA-binding protein
MNKQENIEKFLSSSNVAIVGASRNEKKFGHLVLKHFISSNYKVYPVHPSAKEIAGVTCFCSVNDLPADITSIFIVTPAHATDNIMKSAIDKGISNIWIQQKSETPASLSMAKYANINLIT